jgi:hypothetical protein
MSKWTKYTGAASVPDRFKQNGKPIVLLLNLAFVKDWEQYCMGHWEENRLCGTPGWMNDTTYGPHMDECDMADDTVVAFFDPSELDTSELESL